MELSSNHKKHISETLSKAHKEGRHPGWSHINKDVNRRSYPEKWFIKNVIKEYELISKYTIKEKMPYGKYFLDFAFLELKLDVEIDGQQHFRTQKSIEHDKQRDDFLIKNGWKVYRIAWLEIKQNFNKVVEDFLRFLETNQLYRVYNLEELNAYMNRKQPKYGKYNYIKMLKEKSYQENLPIVNMIIESNIDFSKYGWVNEVAKLTGLKTQKVNKWMKKHMIDFYNDKCFKRVGITPRYERGEV